MPVTLHRYGYVGNNPTNWVDAWGYFVNFAIQFGVGLVAGAVRGSVLEVGKQLFENRGDFSKIEWNKVAASAAGGAVEGAICGVTAGVVCAIGGGFVGGAVEQIVSDVLENRGSIQWGEVIRKGAIGSVSNFASTFVAAKIVPRVGFQPKRFSSSWFGFTRPKPVTNWKEAVMRGLDWHQTSLDAGRPRLSFMQDVSKTVNVFKEKGMQKSFNYAKNRFFSWLKKP